MSETFYPFTPQAAKLLRRLDPPLTAAEWRLWGYLVTLDPFGDRYQELSDPKAVMRECRMSKSTFYAALAKFQKLELFDTQPIHLRFRNLRGQRIVRNFGNQSEESEASPKSRNEFRNLGSQSEVLENRSPNSRQRF
ncbi:hypothetical protein NDI45_27625 [Leptolyngbya sp. GB1-A1]|uniref:hypothetical protein n=1 Tax=Leptolyngbya sp. GB1-A1 TaxID=2933908 RepID=UPI003298F094